MLDQIPTEVLSQIAYHLALPTLSPPVPLLQTCSEVHEALTPINNPRLYARLFRSAFDHAAAARRGADETVQAINLTRELEQRIRLLRRLRRRVIGNNARAMTTAEAWMVYVMLIENGELSLEARVWPSTDCQMGRTSSICTFSPSCSTCSTPRSCTPGPSPAATRRNPP